MKIRRFFASLAQRLFVPHCEDCKFYRPENKCYVTLAWQWPIGPWRRLPIEADLSRKDKDLCGKHGRYFEPKERA